MWVRAGDRGLSRGAVGSWPGWPGVAAGWRRFDTLKTRWTRLGPAKPVLRSLVAAIGRRAVIALMAVVQDAAVHPRHCMPVHIGERLPEVVVEQHTAVAAAAVVHPVAPWPRVPLHGTPRGRVVIVTVDVTLAAVERRTA